MVDFRAIRCTIAGSVWRRGFRELNGLCQIQLDFIARPSGNCAARCLSVPATAASDVLPPTDRKALRHSLSLSLSPLSLSSPLTDAFRSVVFSSLDPITHFQVSAVAATPLLKMHRSMLYNCGKVCIILTPLSAAVIKFSSKKCWGPKSIPFTVLKFMKNLKT